jgi:hypothetical protein
MGVTQITNLLTLKETLDLYLFEMISGDYFILPMKASLTGLNDYYYTTILILSDHHPIVIEIATSMMYCIVI